VTEQAHASRDSAVEVNFDGLIGNTHNYAGLSAGNLASARNARQLSRPREAARQGLAKMQLLRQLGLVQGFLPPHERPHLPTLHRLGFRGTPLQMVEGAARRAPELLAMCSSASAMWAANAATVSPGADSGDGRVHFTPANLVSMPHRAIEAAFTGRVLRQVFADPAHFVHHAPVPGGAALGDEGAANHGRLCAHHGAPGVALFVYGRRGLVPRGDDAARRFPARQALEASAAVARSHGLDPARSVFARQSPAAIDAGAFHNDVVAVANRNVLFTHERAFADREAVYGALRAAAGDGGCRVLEVAEREVSLADAVASYLFNSQLLDLPGGAGMMLLLPEESRDNAAVHGCLERLLDADNPIAELRFIDVRQSMQNGGGPACLRLRVALREAELAAVDPAFLLDDARHEALCAWVDRHYREQLAPADLADPALLDETHRALDELTQLLGTGPLYDFQRP
jgi:succinylarginine dihydrolase